MPRIGIVSLDSTLGRSGGVDVYVRALVEALGNYQGGDHTFVVITSDYSAASWTYRKWPATICFKGVRHLAPSRTRTELFRDGARRVFGLPTLPRHGGEYIARQIDGMGLDLLHFPRTVIYPISVRTPSVLTFFDLQHEYYPQFFTEDELQERARTYRRSAEKAIHLVVPSEYTRRTLEEKYAVSPDKMSLIPVGISAKFQRKEATEVKRIRAKYQLPESFLFYPANPWPHKNHARLMSALRIYRELYGDCPWLVLTGKLRGERRDAMSLAIAAGVEDRVIDLQFVDPEDLPALYSAADLMVFPSLFEGFGIPLVEAMACGCPIVAANATTIPEITNGAALLFDPFDPNQMVEAIHQLLNESDLGRVLVAQGYAQLPRFVSDLIVTKLTAVYESAYLANRS